MYRRFMTEQLTFVIIKMFFLIWLEMCVSAAGNAFSQAALLHLQMQSKHDAASNFIDAGNSFKKADPQGITLAHKVISLLVVQAKPGHPFSPCQFILGVYYFLYGVSHHTCSSITFSPN